MSTSTTWFSDVKPGGAFLLNTRLDRRGAGRAPARPDVKTIAENNIKFYTIDAIKIGREIGLGGSINTILQSAFFKLANIIPIEDAIKLYEGRCHRQLRTKLWRGHVSR
jgi:pyruvate-ferredoxin/flavodoxin oxidoreductase